VNVVGETERMHKTRMKRVRYDYVVFCCL
jgi:hypothetical protein